jgi:pSer/pThr/pTyr-binding forkhead associated (FHA) protein
VLCSATFVEISTPSGMTNVCPQCNAPIPRDASRFCNQCGGDLRAVSPAPALKEPVVAESRSGSIRIKEPVEGGIPVEPHPERPPQLQTKMEDAQNDIKPQRPEATLHILLRDGRVIEREMARDEIRIGKGPQNDIILADASVSGTHALISFESGAFKLSDLGSRNGTVLNEERLAGTRPLRHGDLIKMGHCTITFRLKEADDTLSIQRTQILDPNAPPPPPPAPPVPKAAALTEDGLAAALVSSGLVAPNVIDRLRGPAARGRRLVRALLEERVVTEIGLRDLMSRTFNISPVDLKTAEVDAATAAALKHRFLRERLACPIGNQPDRLMIAVADPTDRATIDEIERITRKKSSLRVATPGEIAAHLDSFFTPRLIGMMPAGEKMEVVLNQPEIEIGKAPHNRLVLQDPTVSSTHAIVLFRNGGYSVVDLGSSNGTFVNGKRLGSESHTLQHGDKIHLGQVLLTFRNPAETVENKTAMLSLDALEEIRRRAMTRGLQQSAQPGVKTDPSSWASPPGVVAAAAHVEGEDKEEKKKKKKKDKDKNSWFNPNALSRILAQVLGALVTLGGTLYLIKTGFQGSDTSKPGDGSRPAATVKLERDPASWENFSTGLLSFIKSGIEASGVAFATGQTGVAMVSDSSESEVLWMQLDQNGKQSGSLQKIPLGVSFRDPEAITYGNGFYYLVTSQSNPKDRALNAIIRFDISPDTHTLRGTPEVINDLRAFLLNNVTAISSLGAPSGMEGGLNIEGLAWDPNNERLLLGLRSPQIGAQAVLVPLKLRDPRGPFNLENLKIDEPQVIVFSLEGHGVRDITYDPRMRNFLIISGAPETSPKTDFGVWEWNGQPDSKPVRIMVLEDKMKPEGIASVTINGASYVLVVGDAGSYLKLNYAGAK